MIVLDIDYMENYKDFTINGRALSRFSRLRAGDEGARHPPDSHHRRRRQGDAALDCIPCTKRGAKGGISARIRRKALHRRRVAGRFRSARFPLARGARLVRRKVPRFARLRHRRFLERHERAFPLLQQGQSRKDHPRHRGKGGKNLSLTEFWSITGSVARLANNADDYASFYTRRKAGRSATKRCITSTATTWCAPRPNISANTTRTSGRLSIPVLRTSACTATAGSDGGQRLPLGSSAAQSENASLPQYVRLPLRRADIGGFGQDTTEDLLLRWTALGAFVR